MNRIKDEIEFLIDSNKNMHHLKIMMPEDSEEIV